MTKQNVSATVDPEVAAYLQREDVNCSGLINKLTQQHMSGGVNKEQMLQMRLDQVESELDSLMSRVDTKERERKQIKEQLEELRDGRDELLSEAEGVFSRDMLQPDNPAVERWSDQTGMTVSNFIEAMKRRL